MSFPSLEQSAVIRTAVEERQSGLVIAGPGAGKSRTALEVARLLLERVVGKKKVLFLSFSNAAIRRLSEASGVEIAGKDTRGRLVFTTYHSLAAEILSSYSQFVGLPGKTKVIDNLEERFVAIQNGWNDSDEKGYRAAIFSHAKQTGEIGFRTLVPLATSLMKSSTTLRRVYFRQFSLVIVDEFQDTSKDQWELLKVVGQDKQVLAFGDPNQIIYASLHNATAERLGEFEEWKGIKRMELPPVSHRCREDEILGFAASLLSGKAYAGPKATSAIQIVSMFPNQLIPSLAAYCLKFLSKTKKSSLGLLVPRNKLADEIVFKLRHPGSDGQFRTPIYARLPQDQTAVESVSLALAALLDYGAKPNPGTLRTAAVALCTMNRSWNHQAGTTPHNVSEIMNAFTSTRMKKNSLAQLPQLVRDAEATTKARLRVLIDFLSDKAVFSVAVNRIQQNYPRRIAEIPESMAGGFFESLRAVRKPQGLYGDEASNHRIQVLTYQRSKGREFDHVIMIVDKYAESSETPLDEKRRLYYVCATRAKQKLFVVYFGDARMGNVLGPVLSPA